MSLHLKVKTRRGIHEFKIQSSHESLLETIEAQKIKMPFGCRSGSCGVCCVEISEGAELLEEAAMVEADTLSRGEQNPQGKRLACRARFKAGQSGNLSVSVPEESK